jgi:propionyl-CoA carboxylase beta chain
MTTDDHKTKLAELEERRAKALAPAGEAANARQRKRGKRTARERVEALVDDGSFVELVRTRRPGVSRRRRRHGPRDDRRPSGLPLLARFHGARWIAR